MREQAVVRCYVHPRQFSAVQIEFKPMCDDGRINTQLRAFSLRSLPVNQLNGVLNIFTWWMISFFINTGCAEEMPRKHSCNDCKWTSDHPINSSRKIRRQ